MPDANEVVEAQATLESFARKVYRLPENATALEKAQFYAAKGVIQRQRVAQKALKALEAAQAEAARLADENTKLAREEAKAIAEAEAVTQAAAALTAGETDK